MKFIITIVEIIRNIREKKINVYAGHAALFLLLALIPFIMALINICQMVSPDIFDAMVQLVHKYLGNYASKAVDYVIQDIHLQSSQTLFWFAVISAIWASSAGTFSIERGLNIIYHNTPVHGYFIGRIISFFYTIFLVALMMISVVFVMFGRILKKLIVHIVPSAEDILNSILAYRFLVIIPLLLLFLMLLYSFYPGRHVRFTDQFLGALLSSVSLYLFTIAFEYYITNISNYSVIYGSMGALMLFVLWIYFTICVILYGAVINFCRKGTKLNHT